MRRENVVIDDNWMSPSALAKKLKTSRYNVSSWIKRDQIDYVEIEGAIIRRHLVDARTAPEVQTHGGARKSSGPKKKPKIKP